MDREKQIEKEELRTRIIDALVDQILKTGAR